jgi:predicted RNase H-like HicB family nuclease
MSRKFNVIIEKDEDGYFVGLVPELPGCHTQAKSLDELHKRLKKAIRLYLEVKKGTAMAGQLLSRFISAKISV